MNILVLDVGTSSMRGTLLNENADVLARHQIQYHPTYKGESIVEQPPSDWAEAMFGIVSNIQQKIAAVQETVDAIAITSQRSSIIPVDKEGVPLMNAVMWQDQRNREICSQMEQYNDFIFRQCGSRVNTVYSGGKMKWLVKERPDIYQKAQKIMVIPDYLIYLLTGRMVTDDTYGSRSLMMNLEKKQWDKELLRLFDVEEEKLCPILPAGSVCGYVTEAFAAAAGIRAGVPVLSCGGDQQCGSIGQGAFRQGVVSVVCGTGGYLISLLDQLPEKRRMNIVCNTASVKDKYIMESSVLTCCSAFDWFRNTFYEGVSLEELNHIIEETPLKENGVITLPYFQGRATPDWNSGAKGLFANVDLSSEKRDFLVSLLEGICFEISNQLDVFQTYSRVDRIYCGGGLTNSRAFCQMLADVCGASLVCSDQQESTTAGAWMVAAVSLGICDSYETAFEKIFDSGSQEIYTPDWGRNKIYGKKKETMNRFYDRLAAESPQK